VYLSVQTFFNAAGTYELTCIDANPPPTPPPATLIGTNSRSAKSNSAPVGAIVGSVLGVFGVVIAIAVLVFVANKRRANQQPPPGLETPC
jgi:hypothetical protein